jgi:hypothetical protein
LISGKRGPRNGQANVHLICSIRVLTLARENYPDEDRRIRVFRIAGIPR